MNVLITGASGFVGRYTVKELVRRGHNVFALVRRTSAQRLLGVLGATALLGDLDKLPSHRKLPAHLDAVIHLAGVIKTRFSREFYRVNTQGTQELLRWLPKMVLQRFVHVSSISARGPNHDENDFEGQGPVSHYGKSKLKSEAILRQQLDAEQSVIVRPPVIYGPGDQATLPLFRLFQKGFFLSAAGAEQRLSFVHVEDVARLLAALVDSPLSHKSLIYPEDSSGGYTSSQIAQIAGQAFERPVQIKCLPQTLVGTLALANTLAGAALGFAPMFCWDKFLEMKQKFWICRNEDIFEKLDLPEPITLSQGLSQTRQWYAENGWI